MVETRKKTGNQTRFKSKSILTVQVLRCTHNKQERVGTNRIRAGRDEKQKNNNVNVSLQVKVNLKYIFYKYHF